MSKTDSKIGNRKILIAIILLILAFILLIGFALAFFSDYVVGQITGTAGTLDLVSTTTSSTRYYTQNGIEANDTETTISNLNPGDILYLSYDVSNDGNRSAYLRNIVSFTIGTNYTNTVTPSISAFEIYEASTTNTDIRNGSATPISTTLSTIIAADDTRSFNSTPIIINGTGVNNEIETGGLTGPVAVGYKLYFKSSAGNEYQGVKISYSIKTEAMQYRNNPSPNWSQITSSTFSL